MQAPAELPKILIIKVYTFLVPSFLYAGRKKAGQEISYQISSFYKIFPGPKPINPDFLSWENSEGLQGPIPLFDITYPCP
jgi:hypothetical protein